MRKSNYGLCEIFKNIFFVFKSKVFFPKSRMIRFPIVVRGKRYIDFGTNLTTGYGCRIEVNGKFDDKRLIFGKNVNVGDYVRISCADKIIIGDNVLMGSRVLIIDNSHGNYSYEKSDSPNISPNERMISTSQVIIEDNVWLGEGVVIQQGVTIGYGSIVAANSVVTKNVAAQTIVGGIPAKIIKEYSVEEKKWKRK